MEEISVSNNDNIKQGEIELATDNNTNDIMFATEIDTMQNIP